MNIFYFVRRFPRRYQTALQQKIFSLAQTFSNEGYKINLVSADLSNPKQYDHLKQYPFNLVHVAPKRISASLSAAQIKPDFAIFNNYQMQEMYSAYLYNKWNKCPRILQVNYAIGLQKWRKSKYGSNAKNYITPQNGELYDQKFVFNEYQKKSILRSDFFITPNDFLYYLLNSHMKQSDRISILSHGYPTREFQHEVRNQQYRPFQSRKHFIFIADFSKQHAIDMLHSLTFGIWSLIHNQLPEAELHIYTSAKGSLKLNLNKKQLQENGCHFKGYIQDLEIIQKYKLMLYPARFSVGMRSKVIQSWLHHTPVITTPVGIEGMCFEMLQAKYAQSQTQNGSGFVNERQFTEQQKKGQNLIKSHYLSNSFDSSFFKKLSFGGSYRNFSYIQFANSAVQFYKNQEKWKSSLKIGQKTIIKNQNQEQLEINVRQAMLKLQLAVYKGRGNKEYEQQWKRIMKTKEYEKKIYQYN